MSLLLPHSEASKERNIFIGDGLPSIPPKLYHRMLNWSYIDMAELQPLGSIECRSLQMCTNCNHIGHETNACPVAASTAGKQFGPASSPETKKVTLPLAKHRAPGNASGVCWEFNYEGRCSYEVCKFRHVCQICQGRHSGIHCTKYGNMRVLSGKRRPGDKAMGYKEFMTQKWSLGISLRNNLKKQTLRTCNSYFKHTPAHCQVAQLLMYLAVYIYSRAV